MTDIPLPAPGDSDWSDWGADEEAMSDIARTLNDMVLTGRLSQATLDATYGQADKVAVAATGITATNVRDALLELLGMADDAGDFWASQPLTLNVNSATYVTDSDHNVPIAAGQTVWLDYIDTFSGANAGTANLKAQLTAPAGATAEWGSALDFDAAGAAQTAKGTLGGLADTKTFVLNATSPTGVHIRAKVTNGSTAGTITIKFAPNTTVASGPPIRNAGSRVVFSKATL